MSLVDVNIASSYLLTSDSDQLISDHMVWRVARIVI